MPVRFRSSAPRAASSMAERQALNLCRSGFKSLVAHHAGVKGTGIPRELRPRGLRVRLAPSALIPGGLLASHQGPEPWPRWFDPSPGLCRRARLRPRPRKAGDPGRHRVAAPCACSPTGRGARSRAWRLRVQIPPGTPGPWVQGPDGPCKSASRGWHSAGAPLAGCSVGRGAAALNRETTLVRVQPGQLAPS